MRSRRRILLTTALLGGALPVLAGGCSSPLQRPYVAPRRFPMDVQRPSGADGGASTPPSGRVLLIRLLRAAPELDRRGLRTLRPDGTVETDFYEEWVAPPSELAEEALRRWLSSSGLFTAVTVPGTRARTNLILEAELTVLQAEPAAGVARAGYAGVLLADERQGTRVLTQFSIEGTAPIPGGAQQDAPAEARATAMTAAMADALAQLEGALRAALPAAARSSR